ncbi:antA/AntB antirepressor family protein [Staphylococcus simulans]|uniref:antA/AntB antirepressor family protein n=1 Tax=Staphylococcus simulans TaxID=1286 RepID=UPI0021CE1CC9|nr:antA/AntB antirepressor family protein [Staphylococcus simulans]UXR29873.1 antA/AntB antirepressor family protein [Staphylococcus simulans]UXV42942.1 antA/AntB antirepressor family protein [Staphylococcus simulans]
MNEIQQLFNLKRNEDGTVAVSGRELHKGLKIETQYTKWVNRMIDYGFEENIDFITISQKRLTAQGNQTTFTDHIMTLDMAKEISMIQRSEIGRKIRGYFIKVERQHNQLASAYGITSLEDMNQLIEQLVSDKLDYLISTGQVSNQKLEELNNKFEGEYVTPQDLLAIKYAVKDKAEETLKYQGLQMTIDTIGDVYEQAIAYKKAEEQEKFHIGKAKRKLLVLTKKHLGMKGNAPNNHIKRKDVDLAIQFINDVRLSAIEI